MLASMLKTFLHPALQAQMSTSLKKSKASQNVKATHKQKSMFWQLVGVL